MLSFFFTSHLFVKIKLKQRLFRRETTFFIIRGGINAIFVCYSQIIIVSLRQDFKGKDYV